LSELSKDLPGVPAPDEGMRVFSLEDRGSNMDIVVYSVKKSDANVLFDRYVQNLLGQGWGLLSDQSELMYVFRFGGSEYVVGLTDGYTKDLSFITVMKYGANF
jgi:hypothetical protein